jgi:hypothetical protein
LESCDQSAEQELRFRLGYGTMVPVVNLAG